MHEVVGELINLLMKKKSIMHRKNKWTDKYPREIKIIHIKWIAIKAQSKWLFNWDIVSINLNVMTLHVMNFML